MASHQAYTICIKFTAVLIKLMKNYTTGTPKMMNGLGLIYKDRRVHKAYMGVSNIALDIREYLRTIRMISLISQ